MKLRVMLGAALSAGLLLGATPAQAQFGGLGKLAKKAGISLPRLQKDPITTSLPDAQWGDPTRDGFVPREPKRALATLQRTAAGAFILQPGYFTFHAQSYCLQAGTYGPGGGEGYLYAPPLGAAREAVMAIVRNSVAHPQIEQRDIQALLWAILARARFENLSDELKMVAAQLLTPRQLAGLNRSALDLLGDPMITNNLPREVRQVMEAEADLRRMLTTPGTSFAELERVAVLAGLAPQGPGSIGVANGRWSHHPDGYYVRYLPHGYTNTTVEIWVPQDGDGAGAEYDPATHIAVPGNTARQRLLQSGRPYASR
jgi:hypothetical protein